MFSNQQLTWKNSPFYELLHEHFSLQFSDHWNDWLPCSAVWLPQESNDGYCPKPDCACWRACWCQANCTCRWIEIIVFAICNRGKGCGVLLKYLWHLRACGTVLCNRWHLENHEHQNDIWKFLFIVWENHIGKGTWVIFSLWFWCLVAC